MPQTLKKMVRASGSVARAEIRAASKLLLTASQNRNWMLRVAALEAIAKRGDTTFVQGIKPRLSDRRREVRFTAAATVIHLDDLAKAQSAAGNKIAQATLSAAATVQSTTATTETTK
jgi:HEAT repeat protein